MGIFNDPKRLAKLLLSFKVPEKDRQLPPIIAAKWLKEAVDELGSVQEVMDRVDLKKTMWGDFQKLLTIHEDIENSIKWGESNPETMELGFSVARVISYFEPSEQIDLVNAMWDYGKPFTHDELRRIKSYCASHSEKSLDDAITNILKFDRPKKTVISIFISGLKESIYENLAVKSTEKNTSLDEFTKQILSKQLPENSVTSVKTRKNLIRIVFSENGKKEFNNLIVSKSISKNDIINYIFQAEGF